MRLNLLSSCLVQFVVSRVKSGYYRHKYLKSFPKPVSSVLIPTQTSTAPTKKKSPWNKVSLLEGAISSQRYNLVFFFKLFLSIFVRLRCILNSMTRNYSPEFHAMDDFSKLEIMYRGAKILLPVPHKIIICTLTGSKNAIPSKNLLPVIVVCSRAEEK